MTPFHECGSKVKRRSAHKLGLHVSPFHACPRGLTPETSDPFGRMADAASLFQPFHRVSAMRAASGHEKAGTKNAGPPTPRMSSVSRCGELRASRKGRENLRDALVAKVVKSRHGAPDTAVAIRIESDTLLLYEEPHLMTSDGDLAGIAATAGGRRR